MSISYEQLLITNELSEVIRCHNECLNRIKAYADSYPYLIAPNIARLISENLKDNLQVLYKELNNLHKPKTEQRRHVCAQCHKVFASSLRGGVCDECRSRGSTENAYATRNQRVDEAGEVSTATDLIDLEKPTELTSDVAEATAAGPETGMQSKGETFGTAAPESWENADDDLDDTLPGEDDL